MDSGWARRRMTVVKANGCKYIINMKRNDFNEWNKNCIWKLKETKPLGEKGKFRDPD